MNDNNMTANAWSDFNDAEAQQSGFNLIPNRTLGSRGQEAVAQTLARK